MQTEHPPHQTVVWVTVEQVQQRQTLWTCRLFEDKPCSPSYGTIPNRGILPYKFCYSYTELSAWLHLYGFTPPPPDYFAPTSQELDEGAGSILRPVMTSPRSSRRGGLT
jgi:hypothetical protein